MMLRQFFLTVVISNAVRVLSPCTSGSAFISTSLFSESFPNKLVLRFPKIAEFSVEKSIFLDISHTMCLRQRCLQLRHAVWVSFSCFYFEIDWK